MTHESEQVISRWLNITPTNLVCYKEIGYNFETHLQEHILLLMLLVKHRHKVFSDGKQLKEWLHIKNFNLDNHPPSYYLHPITSIRFVDDRLTTIEYDDN